jgi:hypothetical protein
VRFFVMLRLLLPIALVVEVGAVRAEPCVDLPRNAAPRPMQLELVKRSEDFPGRVLALTSGAELPAVSADGSMIAQLFNDEMDFTGAPITTLLVWSRSGKQLGRYWLDTSLPVSDAERARNEAKVLREANARLGKTRWRPIAIHRVCDSDRSVLALDDVTVTFDPDAQRLAIVRGGKSTAVASRFPAPGTRMSGNGDGGSDCGTVLGLDSGFGGKAIGLAVVIPAASFGGDSCMGGIPAGFAVAIPVR